MWKRYLKPTLASHILRETITDIRKNSTALAFSGISVISKSAGTSPNYNQFKKQNINYLRMSLLCSSRI